jgi:hypothetical protein
MVRHCPVGTVNAGIVLVILIPTMYDVEVLTTVCRNDRTVVRPVVGLDLDVVVDPTVIVSGVIFPFSPSIVAVDDVIHGRPNNFVVAVEG